MDKNNNNESLSTPLEVMCSVFFAIVFCGLAYVFMWIC